jgi:hypothetical protein
METVVVVGDWGSGKPLESQGGPVQGMRDYKVVQIRRVLLPDFVLLVYADLLLFVELCFKLKVP